MHRMMQALIPAFNPLYVIPILLALLFYLTCGRKKPANYPPGPWGLPIVGNLTQLGTSPHIELAYLSNFYGDLFSVRLGMRKAVVLNSEKVVREALLQRHRHFSSRPPLFTMNVMGVRKFSITFGEYCPVQVQRKRCALKAIHEIVFRKPDHFNKIVHDVFLDFKADLAKVGAETFQPSIQLKQAVTKIILNITFGEDPSNHLLTDELQQLVVDSNEFIESSAAGSMVDFVPWLRPFVRKQIAAVEHAVQDLINFVHKMYTGRKHYLSNDSCIALCLAELLEREKRRNSEDDAMHVGFGVQSNLSDASNKNKSCNIGDEEMVKLLSADIFGAGLGTVSDALSWATAYIVNNPKIQQELHQELDRAVERHRLPTIQDKAKMPLLQATVLEVLRISSLVPLALPHQTSEDTFLGGYNIPKDTLVVINLWAVNHDPRVFENPHIFSPYRFLNENGDVCEKKSKLQMSFSVGSRRCLGSTIAKEEMFLLLACLLQNYELTSAQGNDIDLEGIFGLTWSPKPFIVRARLR